VIDYKSAHSKFQLSILTITTVNELMFVEIWSGVEVYNCTFISLLWTENTQTN